LALRHGSCLLPLKLHSTSSGRRPFRRLPLHSDLIAPPQSSPGLSPDASRWKHSIRERPYPFSPPGCDAGQLQRLFSGSSRTAGWRTPTLAHSSNYRLSPTVFTQSSETTEPRA
jgi:hypothetical protein